MKYNVSFQERAKLAIAQLSKQQPITLEKAKEQALKLKTQSTSKNKKKIV
jgi:hypothetical protein